jgi:hypothetical protein
MSTGTPELEFEVEKEVWNKYELSDDSILKTRVVLLKLIQQPNKNNLTEIQVSGETQIINTISPTKNYRLYGTPFTGNYSLEDLAQAKKVEVNSTQLYEDWNVYRLNDGRKLKTKLVVSSIKRCVDKYDKHGIPVYLVDSTVVINIVKNP